MGKAFVVVLFSAWAVVVGASEPGHPLDCSDWVFLEPGLRCAVFSPLNTLQVDSPFIMNGTNLVTDNTGNLMVLRSTGGFYDLGRIEIRRFNGLSEIVVAYVQDRYHMASDANDHIRPRSRVCCPGDEGEGDLSFDPVNGRLLIPLFDYCRPNYGGRCAAYPPFPDGAPWIAAVDGFASLHEISQSYIPSSQGVGFRSPARPEGFLAADHFDTYWGLVSDLPDFSRATPMQCNYPTTPPVPGDFLSVVDTSPAPASGEASYIVTAVTSGSQRRYGRQAIGGVLSGRNPALLPSCP